MNEAEVFCQQSAPVCDRLQGAPIVQRGRGSGHHAGCVFSGKGTEWWMTAGAPVMRTCPRPGSDLPELSTQYSRLYAPLLL